MAVLSLNLSDNLLQCLSELGTPVEEAVLELIVMDLFRRQKISGGRSAELLGWPLEKFIVESGKQGIPYVRYSPEELLDEVEHLERAINSDSGGLKRVDRAAENRSA